jgi:integrase
MRFAGIARPGEFRTVTRAHVIAWRDDLARRELGGATLRHRLAALSSLFEYLCDRNAVTHNPVKGVKRPKVDSGEGKTPALGDHQARELLTAPGDDTIKEKRDRSILSALLYHALRREELCKLKVRDFRNMRRGVPHLIVAGKGEKIRYLPLHPGTNALIHDYLEAAGHGEDDNGALFRPIKNNRTMTLEQALRVQTGAVVFSAARLRDRRPCAARDRRHQCARPPGRHRQRRYSGTSLGYQLASIIAGGPSPFIATALFAAFASSFPIALYILGCAVIGIVATALLTDYTNKDISEEYDKIAPARAAAV